MIAKLMAERLKKVIEMAFIKGREIMDAALIANECVDSRMKGDEPGVMIEKAYDYVNWNFLLNVLRQLSFGEKWLGWISFCIRNVRFSILVNDEPVGFFPSGRVLRQGYPLFSFLLVLALEGFDSMMRRSIQNNCIGGF